MPKPAAHTRAAQSWLFKCSHQRQSRAHEKRPQVDIYWLLNNPLRAFQRVLPGGGLPGQPPGIGFPPGLGTTDHKEVVAALIENLDDAGMWVRTDGAEILYRAMLLPLSDDQQSVSHLLGAFSFKVAAPG